jgi:hypothetical protein
MRTRAEEHRAGERADRAGCAGAPALAHGRKLVGAGQSAPAHWWARPNSYPTIRTRWPVPYPPSYVRAVWGYALRSQFVGTICSYPPLCAPVPIIRAHGHRPWIWAGPWHTYGPQRTGAVQGHTGAAGPRGDMPPTAEEAAPFLRHADRACGGTNGSGGCSDGGGAEAAAAATARPPAGAGAGRFLGRRPSCLFPALVSYQTKR